MRLAEETAIGQGQFTDPRTISYTATGPTRQEDVIYIKALVNGSNFGLFDVQVTQQQGQFAYVEAKDVNDIISGIQVVMSTAVAANTMLLINTAAAEVYEQRIGALSVTEPSVLGVQVAYAGYFASLVVEDNGIVKITKTP